MVFREQERAALLMRSKQLAEMSKNTCERAKQAVERSKKLQHRRQEYIAQKRSATQPYSGT
jgi:hypothetical protein